MKAEKSKTRRRNDVTRGCHSFSSAYPYRRYNGVLKDVRPDDLGAFVIQEAIKRAGIAPTEVEDVILGCANQLVRITGNIARMALLLAGLPLIVSGQTVNRLCGSGLQAVNAAAQSILANAGDVFVAGGVRV